MAIPSSPSEPRPPPFYAKSGGVWQRDPETLHGHLIATEDRTGAAEMIATALNHAVGWGNWRNLLTKGERLTPSPDWNTMTDERGDDGDD